MENIENSKISELEERIKILEEKLNQITITFSEAKEVTMTSGPIGEIHITSDCTLNIQNSSIGSVIDINLDEAEDRLDELEGRLDELNDGIDEAEEKLDELEK